LVLPQKVYKKALDGQTCPFFGKNVQKSAKKAKSRQILSIKKPQMDKLVHFFNFISLNFVVSQSGKFYKTTFLWQGNKEPQLMKNLYSLIFALLLIILNAKLCFGQDEYLNKEYPLELVLRNDSIIYKGIISSMNDTAMYFLPLNSLRRKHSYYEFNSMMNTRMKVPYANINFIHKVRAKPNSSNKIINETGKCMLIGFLLGTISGYVSSKNYREDKKDNSHHIINESEYRAASIVVGGLVGLGAGATLGVVLALSTSEKVYEKLEFPLDPNSIESQREMVSKLIYK